MVSHHLNRISMCLSDSLDNFISHYPVVIFAFLLIFFCLEDDRKVGREHELQPETKGISLLILAQILLRK